jgi:hypothetical protein
MQGVFYPSYPPGSQFMWACNFRTDSGYAVEPHLCPAILVYWAKKPIVRKVSQKRLVFEQKAGIMAV